MSADGQRVDGQGLVWMPGEIIGSQCAFCRHKVPGGPACKAFPSSIPGEISANLYDHRKPWLEPETGQPGDVGMTGDRSILFEPRLGVDQETLARLYKALDVLSAAQAPSP